LHRQKRNCFNSTLVRLGRLVPVPPISPLHGFNSTLVRLGLLDADRITVKNALFQFHSGSIRAILKNLFNEYTRKFQFHSGSIRALFKNHALNFIPGFNSTLVRLGPVRVGNVQYNGTCFNSTLVRLGLRVSAVAAADRDGFQFHSGSIRASKHHRISASRITVSIPLWFD